MVVRAGLEPGVGQTASAGVGGMRARSVVSSVGEALERKGHVLLVRLKDRVPRGQLDGHMHQHARMAACTDMHG